MKDFVDFVREQGVVGLAVGFILGGAVSAVVSSLVKDIINPLLGIVLGSVEGLAEMSLKIGSVEILWGSFVGAFINFVIVAAVVYFGFRLLRLDAIDKKKK